MIGESLGPYKIIEPLGAGGMGEVYLGEDTRLGRKVAIKVLPAEFASDAERLARFEQEARAAAALNHPHIAVVHDIGFEEGSPAAAEEATSLDLAAGAGIPAAGIHYMVQEYLDGETLRAPIERNALSLKKTLALGTEVAEALAAAHAVGIVHRDLKPDNIFIAKEGHAKVLDFGLAKLTEAARPVDASMSPTMLGTVAGQVVGTAGYMAPEQVRGDDDIDGRADLFALGCVLYEMVTGRRAFTGDNIHDVLNKILSQQPQSAAQMNPDTPPKLEWIIEKALAKEREERYQTAGDAVVDLKAAAGTTSSTAIDVAASSDAPPTGAVGAATAAERTGVSPAMATLAAILTLVIGVGIGRAFLGSPASTPANGVVRFDIGSSESGIFSGTNHRVIAISPDGRTIGLNTGEGIWTRALDAPEGTIVAGTSGAREPFFSPDSTQVGFWMNGRVRWGSVDGNTPISDGADIERPLGTTWGDDGFIYVGQGTKGIWRIDPAGGEAIQVAAVDPPQLAQGPELLPGGEWLLFTIATGMSRWDDAQIVAHSLVTGDRVVLEARGREPRYAHSGHLLYVRAGVLYAAPFDPEVPELTGSPLAMESPVLTSTFDFTGAAYYDVSDNGNLVYIRAAGSQNLQLTWIDPNGRREPLPIAPEPFGLYRLSPDRQRLAAEVWDPILGTHISVFDVDRPLGSRLTTDDVNRNPVWAPDGQTVYFASDRNGDFDIWSRRTDMSGPAEIVYHAPGDQVPAGVAPDGSFMVMVQLSPINSDIWRLPLAADQAAEALVATPIDEANVDLSRDGRLIVYQTHEVSIDWTISVTEVATGERWIMGNGWFPSWSSDGSRIFFHDSEGLAAVDVTSLDPFESGELRRIELLTFDDLALGLGYVGSLDDGRILLALPTGSDIDQAVTLAVAINWFEELKERVPAGR